jgi:hypothetical protein
MPRLNANGDVLAGVAGVQGSFNRTPYPFQTFGGGAPLDASTVLLSIPAPAPMEAELATWHPGDVSPLVIDIGPNDFAADGGRWIAWRAGTGAYGSLGALPDAGVPGPHAVGPDGAIAYVPNRAIGYGLVLVDPNGVTHDIPGIVPYGVQVLGAGQLIYQGGAYGRLIPVPAAANAQGVLLATMDDGDWLAYWADGLGFVVQLDGAIDGYILGTTPTFFNHDIRNVHGSLIVAWSLTQGEGPSDVQTLTIDRSVPRVPLVPSVLIPTFTFTHPVVVAPFKDPDGASTAPMEIVVNQTGQLLDRPCFVAEDSLQWRGELEGIYTEALDPTAALALALEYETRLVLAHDSTDDWTLPAGLREYDLPTLELYLSEAETLAQSVTRWQRQVEALLGAWSGSIGVIPMFYCMGGAPPDELFTVDQVLAGLGYLSDIVNLSARIVVIAPFSYLRANGITGHVELEQAYANLLAEQVRVGLGELPAVAPPEPEPGPEPPEPEPQPPEPEPEPPKGPEMVFIETKYEKTNPNFAVMKFNVITNADGTESYSSVARLASADADERANPIYCVTDQGKDEWRASPGGSFESFRRVGQTLVADRPWNGVENSYVRFCVEVS